MTRQRPAGHRSRSFPASEAGSQSPHPLSPPPRSPLPAVYLAKPVTHPLIFRKRIERIDRSARAGDWVAVYHRGGEPEGELLGYGMYNPRSEIAVRLVRLGTELPDEAFWDGRLREAVALRRETLRLDEAATAYRVLHAETDGVPGLVVDKLGFVLSAEAFSLGMYLRAGEILDRLHPLCGTKHWLLQPSPSFVSQEGRAVPAIGSVELPSGVTVEEYGTRFRVQFASGHKTGFFCDQRENRRLLAQMSAGKSVLDLCCYTGGFAVQAMRLGPAAQATGVDLDEEPLVIARQNAALNNLRVRFVQADAFAYMRDMLRQGRQFDVVVLDPPKFIRNRAEKTEGTRRYFDMNRLAMCLVRRGGIFMSCCCSGLLGREEFERVLFAAFREANAMAGIQDGSSRAGERPSRFQILNRTGAAADHPVSSDCPETEYLHAVWMRLL